MSNIIIVLALFTSTVLPFYMFGKGVRFLWFPFRIIILLGFVASREITAYYNIGMLPLILSNISLFTGYIYQSLLFSGKVNGPIIYQLRVLIPSRWFVSIVSRGISNLKYRIKNQFQEPLSNPYNEEKLDLGSSGSYSKKSSSDEAFQKRKDEFFKQRQADSNWDNKNQSSHSKSSNTNRPNKAYEEELKRKEEALRQEKERIRREQEDINRKQRNSTDNENLNFTQKSALEFLGLTISSPKKDYKEAFNKELKKVHPDNFEEFDEDFKKLANEKMKKLNAVKEILDKKYNN